MATKTVTVTNTKRDTKDLGWWTATGKAKEGTGVRLLLGSQLDAGVVNVPQPSAVVDRDVWAAVVGASKAVRGWMESGDIAVYEGAQTALSPASFMSQVGA